MAHLFKPRNGITADALRRGFGGDEFGMSGLKLFEFGPEGVVLHVGDDRTRFNIVEAVMVENGFT